MILSWDLKVDWITDGGDDARKFMSKGDEISKFICLGSRDNLISWKQFSHYSINIY